VTFTGSITDNPAATLTAAGSVEKRGEGTLTLAGLNTYEGGTIITAGRLDIESQILGDVTVATGATFGGTSSVIGSPLVTVNGTIAPGKSIGTLTVGDTGSPGSVVFNTGSTLEAEVDDTGKGDLLLINGTVDIKSGAQVLAIPQSGAFSGGVTVPILNATDGSIGGEFDPLTSSQAFIDTDLIQFLAPSDPGGDPDCRLTEVCIRIERNDATFEQFAETENQTAVAVGLDEAEDTATGDLSLVYQNLTTLRVDEVQPALDALGGEQLSEFPTTRLSIASRFNRSIHERVRGFAWRKSEALFSWNTSARVPGIAAKLQLPAAPEPRVSPSALRSAFAFGPLGAGVSLAPDASETGPGVWIDGFGILGDLDGGANASDVEYTIAGTSLGVDGRLANHWVVGGAAGYARTIDLAFEQRSGSGEANTFQGALYAGRSTSRSYLSASGRFAYSDMDTTRRIVFADIDRRATASFNGWDAGASVEGGVNLVELWGVSVQPLASFDYVHVDTEGYTEKGADSIDLKVKSQSLDSMVSGLGLRLHGTVAMDRDSWITPEVRVRWGHEFGDRDRRIDGRITGATTGGAWRVRGANAPADGLVVGASWTVTTAGNFHVFADYDAALNEDLVEHSLAVGIRFEW
jgi:outer membrane autotransporter protein